MKILTKIPKLQMRDVLHKNVNENAHFYANFHDFLWWAIKAICYSFTLLIPYMYFKSN